VLLNGIGGSRKGENVSEITQEVGSQKQIQMWTEYEPWCTQIEYCVRLITKELNMGNFRRKDPTSGLTSGFSKMRMPLYIILQFLLFPKLKNALMGQRFADIPDIQGNVTLLRGTLKNYFQDCFWRWRHCLTKSIASQGEYFKGNSSH
jgi:hypothetical protein